MHKRESVKFLSIEGIECDKENIIKDKYPYTAIFSSIGEGTSGLTYEKIEKTFTDIKFAVLDYFKSNDISGIVYELKDKAEIVTTVDRDVDSIIISRIMKDFPDHRIVSEESGVTGGGGGFKIYCRSS